MALPPAGFEEADMLALRVRAEGLVDPLVSSSDLGFQFDQLFVEGMEQAPSRNLQFVPIILQ